MVKNKDEMVFKKAIGYISYAHGLDGKVKIVPLVLKEKFEEYVLNNEIILDDDNYSVISIKIFAFTGKIFLCKIDGISDIEMTKRVVKHRIFVEEHEDSNTINPEFLVGFDVFLLKTRDKKDINKKPLKYGKVVDYGDYGAGDLIEVETQNGKREFFLCNKNVIFDVNLKNKSIIIRE